MVSKLWGLLRSLPLLILSPLLVGFPMLALALTDLCWAVGGRRKPPVNSKPDTRSASVVIPNWNGRDLLEKYLPSVVEALSGHPDNELIVVENGSTDGSAQFVKKHFPTVRLLELPKNLGFGGGSNAGFRAAKNDIVVLLNSDMRVDKGFLHPLLDGFTDERVFAVSCQIFFSDPDKLREETGLTQCWWESGGLRARHRIDEKVTDAYPCFYGGGGSCAFDRRKFLELGGFDELLRPFYLEDTDLGYGAWKRGWKVLYQPRSIVFHEHRGTIGKSFSRAYIDAVVKKNFVLFAWKNIHSWRSRQGTPSALAGAAGPSIFGHFFYAWAGAIVSALFGDSPERPNLYALWKAFWQTGTAMRARWQARSLATVDDTEAFRRPLGGYFRDRFAELPQRPDRLNVLFVSPYSILPPVHGGAVFMSQTCRHLAELTNLHLIALIDDASNEAAHEELTARCRSAEFLIRFEGQTHTFGSMLPHAIHEYASADLEWIIHRQLLLQQIDVLQLEYLQLGQYTGQFQRLATFLFEHDIYFQSVGRQLASMPGIVKRASATYEYLRGLRYELKLLSHFDRVQVCSTENEAFVKGFLTEGTARLDPTYRAGIDVARYEVYDGPRTAKTMLFLGSFRHAPNVEALEWLVQHVMPVILATEPAAKLMVIGSDPPPRYSLPDLGDAIDLRGYVDDIHAPMRDAAVFLCPIRSGSGVRVKLLESFASGIPVVSTRIGAEGIAHNDGEICMLADDPREFAEKILALFRDPVAASAMAARARHEMVTKWDMAVRTLALVESYRKTVEAKRNGARTRS
ncbi:MAG: glycosyltransferase [Acidobacteriota bacterium]